MIYTSRAFALALGGALLLAGCQDHPVGPGADEPSADAPLGLVEVTISGIGGEAGAMTASAGPLALDVPGNTDGSGDGSIELDFLSSGSFTDGERDGTGERYVYATFRARNAQSDGTAYDTPRENLTFLAVTTGSTINGTAVSSLRRFDGSSADPEIAHGILPTGAVRRELDGGIGSRGPDVLQVITEAEASAISAPSGVTSVFPYGFVVRNANDGGRTLAASPAAEDYDGVITFAFRIPLQASAADDPYSVSMMFLAMDDDETRITQSLEEQDAEAQAAFEARAAEIGAAGITLLAGGSYGADDPLRLLCDVRTAGTAGAAAAILDEGLSCAADLPRYYVSASAAGMNTGANWDDAFPELQSALALADAGDEVWVAGGTYYPDEGPGQTDDDRSASFTLQSGVGVYGGFAGTESRRDSRNWAANVTTLSGDVDGNDAGAFTNDANNAYHVVRMSSGSDATTVLDGFTITAGYAEVPSSANGRGAGLYCGGVCRPTLRNLTFAANRALRGGAIYNQGASGGDASPAIVNTLFVNNRAFDLGGALFNDGYQGTSSPTLSNVTFADNEAVNLGGAVYNQGRGGVSNPALSNAILWGNTAGSGGSQIYNSEASSTVNHSLVQGGYAGTGNLDVDPLFVDAASGDLRLQYASPAINAGANALNPFAITVDLDGNPRVYSGGTVDMGAYEFQSTSLADLAANSIVTADPIWVEADGASTSTITVQLRDENGANLTASGGTVALDTDPGSLGAVTDHGDGTYSATLTASSTTGVAILTGTVDGAALADQAQVEIGIFAGCAQLRPHSIGSTVNSSIGTDDCRSVRRNAYSEFYTFSLGSSRTVRIDMTSSGIDTYLYLWTREGQLVIQDDDSGAGLNSLIQRELPPGDYVIEATTFRSNATGAYQLQTR